MLRGDQLARQWKIIQTLITSRRGKSAADLAEELECHPRTLYRDLEALQVAGFPMYTDRVEGKNLWSLLDTLKHHIPIPFNLTELIALYFSTDMLKVFKGTAFHDSLESLSQKIKATLPPESMKYLKNVEQTLKVGIKPYKDYSRFKDGSIVFEVEVAGTEEIKFWVMSWGSKALVFEPESLREKIRAESEALLGKYEMTRNARVCRCARETERVKTPPPPWA